MATYYLWNIGCQMNKAESERMSDYLEGLGYRPVSPLLARGGGWASPWLAA